MMAASCAVWLPCRAPRVRRGLAERGGPAVLTRRAQLSRPRGAVAGPDVEGDVPTRDRVSCELRAARPPETKKTGSLKSS